MTVFGGDTKQAGDFELKDNAIGVLRHEQSSLLTKLSEKAGLIVSSGILPADISPEIAVYLLVRLI